MDTSRSSTSPTLPWMPPAPCRNSDSLSFGCSPPQAARTRTAQLVSALAVARQVVDVMLRLFPAPGVPSRRQPCGWLSNRTGPRRVSEPQELRPGGGTRGRAPHCAGVWAQGDGKVRARWARTATGHAPDGGAAERPSRRSPSGDLDGAAHAPGAASVRPPGRPLGWAALRTAGAGPGPSAGVADSLAGLLVRSRHLTSRSGWSSRRPRSCCCPPSRRCAATAASTGSSRRTVRR